MKTHVMIDLETLSSKPNAVITEIAVGIFDANDIHEIHTFRVDPVSCKKYGGDISLDTIAWWARKNSDRLRQFIENEDAKPIDAVLADISRIFNQLDRDNMFVWAKSPQFDLTILKYYIDKIMETDLWHYRNERDARTVYDLANVSVKDFIDENEAHYALHDVHAQIRALYESIKFLGLYTYL